MPVPTMITPLDALPAMVGNTNFPDVRLISVNWPWHFWPPARLFDCSSARKGNMTSGKSSNNKSLFSISELIESTMPTPKSPTAAISAMNFRVPLSAA